MAGYSLYHENGFAMAVSINSIHLRLLPNRTTSETIRATVERLNAVSMWLIETAGAHRLRDRNVIQRMYYHEMREQFGLPSQMALRVIVRCIAATKAGKGTPPAFDVHDPVPYDPNMVSFRSLTAASLLTLEGRVEVPLKVLGYGEERFGTALLTWKPEGVWMTVPCNLPPEP